MRKTLATFLALVTGVLVLTVGQALGAAQHGVALKTVKVVMHDPGCHWFSVNGKYLTKLSVTGPIALANYDEATLKIVGPSGVRHDGVGKKITLEHGIYKITMVGQASDDNHLRLVVK
jgi:hypothetical protein